MYLFISGVDGIENREIYETYMHFCRTSYTGKQSVIGTPSNLGLILEHITNLDEVRILSMYRKFADIWFSVMISKVLVR